MQFKQAAADAGVSTEAMGVQVEAAGQKILEASTRAATFTVELGKVRAAGMEAANQLQTLQGHGTSLTGMFTEMIKTGTPVESFLGKLGSYGALAVIAFEGAKLAGERLGAGLTALAGVQLDLIDAQRREQDMLAATGLQLQAVAKGAMDMGGSVAEMTANWNNYLLAQGRGTQAMKDAAAATLGIKMATLDYAAEQAKVASGAALLEGLFKADADAQADLAVKTQTLTTVQIANDAAEKSGTQTSAQKHDADWRLAQAEDAVAISQATATAAQYASIQAVTESKASIDAYMAKAREMGDAIPVAFREAIDAAESMRKKNADLLQGEKDLVAGMKNLPAAMQNSIDSEKGLAAADKLVSDSHDKLIPALDKILGDLAQETTAAGTNAASFDKIAQAQSKAALELDAYARANQLTSAQVIEMVRNQGGLVKALNDTNSEYAKSLVSKYGADMALASERTKDEIQNQKDLAAAAKTANDEFDKQAQFLKNRNAAIVDGTTQIDANGNAVKQAADKEGTWTAVLMTVTAATDAQTASLKAMLEAQNAYTDAVAKSLTIAKGWNDELAGLADSYKSGAIDILQYKQALEAFQTNLEQTFSGATGEAKKQLDAMTQAIQVLINTASGGGDTTQNTFTGQLNKTFNNP
jgi:acetolactate synthase regulatory subunit